MNEKGLILAQLNFEDIPRPLHWTGAVNKESLENEVADVHRNIPWAQQAEKKSQLPGF